MGARVKIAFVEVAGFRGFRDKVRFDLPEGFVVLTGRNGVGKSTVLDAIDFAITGTINKYSVKGAKGHGLEDHIWWVGDGAPEDEYVSVGFVRDGGDHFVITRSRERGLHGSEDEIVKNFCLPYARTSLQTLMQTTLIRDETLAGLSLDLPEQARATAVRTAIGGLLGPDHAKRTGAILQATTNAKDEQRERVALAQADLGRTLTAVTEARRVVETQSDVTAAERTVAAIAPDIADLPGDRASVLRDRVAERKRSIAILEEALARADELQRERLYLYSEAGEKALTTALGTKESTRREKDDADARLAEAQRLDTAERARDALVGHLLALLDHGEALGLQNGHCPLCDAARSSEEFNAAVSAARSRLSTQAAMAARTANGLERARTEVERVTARLASATQQLVDLETRRKSLKDDTERIARTFSEWSLAASPADPDTARRLLLERQDETARLEHALFILESSGAHDRVTALETRVEQLRAQLDGEIAKVTEAERAVEAARQIDSAAKEVANQILAEQFDTVMPLLKELYQRLRPHTDWREIETDFGGRVRASLNLIVGDGRNPQFLFSSGQRRAAGIAFLLAIHLSRPWCLLHSLLLDDPVQHIDDYRALNLVEVLSAVRRTGHQVLIAVEDPALADLLCRRLRSTTLELGRRFELGTASSGSAAVLRQVDISPLPREILTEAIA
jgi:chromosome segregation protein